MLGTFLLETPIFFLLEMGPAKVMTSIWSLWGFRYRRTFLPIPESSFPLSQISIAPDITNEPGVAVSVSTPAWHELFTMEPPDMVNFACMP